MKKSTLFTILSSSIIASLFLSIFILSTLGLNAQSLNSIQSGKTQPQALQGLSASKISYVMINEFVASNDSGAQDEAGEYEDWIELYNTGDNEVNLSGYYLSDKTDNLVKWQFPEGTVIASHAYLIIWADEDQEDGSLHTNFKLSADGESVLLVDTELNIIDQYTYAAVAPNMAYARIPNGTGNFVVQQPTFSANNEGGTGIETPVSTSANILKIYPIPAKTTLNLNAGNALVGKRIDIINLIGQTVFSEIMGPTMTINVESLEKGIYFIRCDNITKKFIKE